jgi:hypothetical protein
LLSGDDYREEQRRARRKIPYAARQGENQFMTPLDKVPGVDNDPSKRPDDEDFASEWAEEDREIEDRKPDLGEIEEDTSEL